MILVIEKLWISKWCCGLIFLFFSTIRWSSPDYSGCTAYSTSMLREYMIVNSRKGSYNFKADYFSKSRWCFLTLSFSYICSHSFFTYHFRSDLVEGAIIWFTIYSNFCRDNEEAVHSTMRLTESLNHRRDYAIGEIKSFWSHYKGSNIDLCELDVNKNVLILYCVVSIIYSESICNKNLVHNLAWKNWSIRKTSCVQIKDLAIHWKFVERRHFFS